MEDSIFTKIIKGEIPSHKVHEDDKTIVIMDIAPIQPGMILVIPKVQVENFYDLSDEYYQAVWSTVKQAAKRLKIIFPNKKRIGIQVEGLDVPHVHIILLPIDNGKEYRSSPNQEKPDHAALAHLAEALAF